MTKEQLGRFIAEHRKGKEFTQKDLAEKLCVTDKAVSKWERGLSFPDVTLLQPLADCIGYECCGTNDLPEKGAGGKYDDNGGGNQKSAGTIG